MRWGAAGRRWNVGVSSEAVGSSDTPRRDARSKAHPSSATDPHPATDPGDRRGPLRAQALRRRRRHGSRRRVLRRPREAARRRPLPLAGRAQLARGRDARRSTPTTTACAGRAPSRSRCQGQWEFAVEAWIDLFATWRDELSRKVARRPGRPLGRAVRGRGAARAGARAGQGRRQARDRARAEAAARRRRARPGALRRRALPGARRGDGARPGAPRRHPAGEGAAAGRRPRAGALRLLVRGLPALLGRAEGRRGARPRALRAWASTWST